MDRRGLLRQAPLSAVRVVSFAAASFALFTASGHAGPYTVKQLLDARFDPSVVFWTIETEHFRIHFADGLDETAQHVAALVEPVHGAVTRRLGWEPRQRTDVVLVYDSERTNAFTVMYPATQILINSAPPGLSQAILHYGDWMRWLLAHEYAHVVHLDRVSGLSGFVRPAVGSLARPNLLQPVWLKEGIAVLVEGEVDSAGRAGSSTYRMITRAAYRAGLLGMRDFGALDSASYQKGEAWPWIHRSYLWGSALVYGMLDANPDALPDLVKAGARGVPGGLSGALDRAELPRPHEVQARAVELARERARDELGVLRRKAETPVEHLTRDGYNKFGLAVDPQGTELVFLRERPEDDNQTILLELDEEGSVRRSRPLFPRQNGYHFSYSRSGRFIAFDDIDLFERHYLWSDLFLFDRDREKALVRSEGLRGRDPDIHPDGRTIAFIQTGMNRNQLMLCDSGFGNLVQIYRPDRFNRPAQPRWNPDGSALMFMEHDDTTGGDRLLLWDGGERIETLTDGQASNRDPTWSPDGRLVLFSSDRGGAFQIYALDVETGFLQQVTHRYGGAFWPVVDPRQRSLYFLDYGPAGYDVVRMRWRPSDWWAPKEGLWLPKRRPLSPVSLSEPHVVEPDDRGPRLPEPYRSTRYLRPLYVQPSLVLRRDSVQLGLATGGVDPAYRQHYSLAVRFDTASTSPVGDALFYDGSRRLPWTFEAFRDVFRVEDEKTQELLRVEGRVYVALGDRQNKNLSFGASAELYSRDDTTQLLAGGSVRFAKDSLISQPNDLVPESGSQWMFDAALHARKGTSPLVTLAGEWQKPFRIRTLGPHTVATTSVEAGWVESRGGPEYVLYGGGRASFPFSLSSQFELGGYAPNVLAADAIVVGRLRLTRPILSLERGFATVPGYLDRLAIGVVAEYAALRRAGSRSNPWSVGVELVLETEISTLWPTVWTLGLHRGDPDTGGQTRLVFSATLLK